MIKTVLGYIEDEQLGFTHCHEHIWISGSLPETCPVQPLNDYSASLKELRAFRAVGGNSIVDCNPPKAGGDFEYLKQLSLSSGVNIIASTGYHRACFYSDYDLDKSVEYFINQYSKEIEEGGGIIKMAVESCGIDKKNAPKHIAAALTGQKYDLPVIMHVEKECDLQAILDFYDNLGLKPERLILCHCDRMIADLNEHIKALERGVYLEYDTIHRLKYHDNEQELMIIKTMTDCYPDQILLGLDSTRQRLGSYGGDTPLTYLSEIFIPLMKEKGISTETIEKLMIYNPRKALSTKEEIL